MNHNRVKIGQSRMLFYPDTNEGMLHQQFEHVVFDLPPDLPQALVQLVHDLVFDANIDEVFRNAGWWILPVLTPEGHQQLYEHGIGLCMGCGAVLFVGPYSRVPPFFCDQACAQCYSSVVAGSIPDGAPLGVYSFGRRPPGQASEIERLRWTLTRHFCRPNEEKASQASA